MSDMTTTVQTRQSDDVLIERAEGRALLLLTRSLADTSRLERASSRRMARLLADDRGRDLLLRMTDVVLRIRDPRRSALALRDMVRGGVPRSLAVIDRLGLSVLGRVATWAPWLTRLLVQWRIALDTDGVILSSEDPAFARYVRRRTAAGFGVNVNILGEAILGDDEADERCRALLARIRRPDVTYVSVKISAICANLDILAEEHSLRRLSNRLADVYRAAHQTTPATFVNLDMEEFRDLELSLRAFMAVLDQPEFADLEAGIVLQAYLPDSHEALRRLCEWANARHARGGAGIKVRLVKGANLAMEAVDAELHGWTQAPYSTKAEVDASYKAMLEAALTLGEPGAVRVGVASHNLFDVAWALTLREELGAADRIEIEMLEGMASPQARAVRDDAGAVLLYSPIVSRREREASIAYLSRRLDENAAPENFLRALFDLTPGSAQWDEQLARFRAAVRGRHVVSTTSRRTQDRMSPAGALPVDGSFDNAADTDFTVAANRRWIDGHLRAVEVPAFDLVETVERVDALVAAAVDAQVRWRDTSWAGRREVLARTARVMTGQRGRTIAVLAHTTGKTVREGDPEVSEAIDFVTYAAHLTLAHEAAERESALSQTVQWQPHRVVLVAGPWNFPYAIPASGLVHAIAAGAAVILKPAPEARAAGALLVEHLLAAGVPQGLVQLACTPDNEVGQHLVTHADVDLVMLTGSLATASLFQSWKPDMRLHAETSGKNAMVITAAADIDQALKDLVKSAFGHAGQKCSAAGLAIVEASVYDDPDFHRRLADAVRSIQVGAATDLATVMGPLIAQASGPLSRALTTLDPGQRWLVEPRHLGGSLWSPGVRRDVQPGSWLHLTECFGPVLGLMRARDLDHAIELQNAPMYGLTGGIQSLDPAEVAHWLDRVQVGNAYVNRPITGAIVRRQPFGGWKASSIGAGGKPGGPGHLQSYGTWTSNDTIEPAAAQASFEHAWRTRFSLGHDATGMASESNVLRYRPVDRVIARVRAADTAEVAALQQAAVVTGVPLTVSVISEESDETLAACLADIRGEVRLRLLAPASHQLLAAAHQSGVAVDTSPVIGSGDLELPHWLKEQAISTTMHRHGRLLANH